MSIKAILFDLDGTLLPMDQDLFTEGYFRLLAEKMAPYGYEPKKLIDAIWRGTAAMVKNNGSRSNEEAFWEKFIEIYGEKVRFDQALFEEFYCHEFQKAKELCKYQPQSSKIIQKVKELGFRAVLATNPIFPAAATKSRVQWAGLDLSDFEWYTVYENIGFCKPNLHYYKEIAERLKLRPEECLMVGNDVTEDMAAKEIGMEVFLLTDCLINRESKDIRQYPHGSFDGLLQFIMSAAAEFRL